ncbi:MAG: cytochrome c [Caulobacterales bacterium]|nr:cytochrome c [Caulobacterales bacterium]
MKFATPLAALIAAAAMTAALATPVLADEPGPGGSRPLVPKTGEEVYRYVCQACHMEGGKGAVGAGTFPALANNPKLGTPAFGIYMVEKGKGGMPYFSDSLTPAQVAMVLTYVRTHFGNNYPQPVTEADVRPFAKPPAGGR